MKHIILFAIAFMPLFVMAESTEEQNKSEIKTEIISGTLSLSAIDENQISDEIRHLKYCLNKYRQDKLTGFWLTVGGSFTAALSVSLYQYDVISQETAAIGYIAGGATMVTGGVMQLISHRWLKKAYMGPSGSGLTIGLNF